MKTYRVIVYGRVQGVGFRAFIYKQARNLLLKGYVKNMSNGTVQIVLQGPEKQINQLVELAKDGPSLSNVTNIKITEEDMETFTDFHIE
jgi:acylphosphatase